MCATPDPGPFLGRCARRPNRSSRDRAPSVGSEGHRCRIEPPQIVATGRLRPPPDRRLLERQPHARPPGALQLPGPRWRRRRQLGGPRLGPGPRPVAPRPAGRPQLAPRRRGPTARSAADPGRLDVSCRRSHRQRRFRPRRRAAGHPRGRRRDSPEGVPPPRRRAARLHRSRRRPRVVMARKPVPARTASQAVRSAAVPAECRRCAAWSLGSG